MRAKEGEECRNRVRRGWLKVRNEVKREKEWRESAEESNLEVVRRGEERKRGRRGTVGPCTLWEPRGPQVRGFESWPGYEGRKGIHSR